MSDPSDLTRLLDHFADGLVATTPDRRITLWSRGAEAIFGHSQSDALDRSFDQLVLDGAGGPAAADVWRRALEDGVARLDTPARTRSGTEILTALSLRCMPGVAGEAPTITVVVRDVTREHCLRESELLEAQYRGFLDTSPDAKVVVDRGGRILLTNTQAMQIFGYERNELIGSPVELLVPDRYRAQHPEYRQGYFRDPKRREMGASLSLQGRRKDGTEFPAEIALAPMRTERGLLAVAAIRDVTNRRAVETKFRGLLEAAPDGIVIVNADGRIVIVNSQVERLFGYDRAELLDQPIEILVPDQFKADHPDRRRSYFNEPRPRGMGSGLELCGRRKDGSEFPAEISLSPLETEDGTLVTAAIRDVTERRRLLEDVRRKAAELEEQNRRVQQASRMKSEFLANMSHELRTPLNAIIGFAELMHDGRVGAVSEDHKEFLGDILTSSRHLLKLINDVLDLSKVEAGQMQFRGEPANLPRIVHEVIDVLRGLIAEKRLTTACTIDPALTDVVLDPARFKQVLYNYLSNAVKFTPEGGRIEVRVEPEGPDWFRMDVVDTGIGIPSGEVHRLFVEFQQLDSGSGKKYPGTGLGLSLTKRLVEAQGGTVGAESTAGAGSRFWIRMPRNTSGAEAPFASVLAPVSAPGAPLVLVVEDELPEREWMSRELGRAGYGVLCAATADEARWLLRKQRFDAATLDLLLPDASGWKLLAEIRADPATVSLPVLVVTQVAEPRVATQFHVHAHLVKPVESSLLIETLASAGVVAERPRPGEGGEPA